MIVAALLSIGGAQLWHERRDNKRWTDICVKLAEMRKDIDDLKNEVGDHTKQGSIVERLHNYQRLLRELRIALGLTP